MKNIKLILVGLLASTAFATTSFAADTDLVKKGEKVFNTKKLGNCLACHAVAGKDINGPGSLGPKLQGLAYWDEKTLYDTVYDIYSARGATNTSMPSFGKSGWLSDSEIKAVVAYLKTIQ